MNWTRLRLAPARSCFILLGAALSALGCGEADVGAPASSPGESAEGDTSASEARSVCPTCPVLMGGESHDFGGSLHTCTLFEEHVAVDAAEASALGFDVPTLQQRVERNVDAPLRWTPGDAERLRPPDGYEAQTRIQIESIDILAYTHVRLDPNRCDQGVCFEEDAGEWLCSDRLELVIDGELRTLDGAIHTSALGYVLQGRPGFPFEEPAGDLFAGLRDVTGSLRVFPNPSLEILYARLVIDLYFKAEHTEGYVRVDLKQSDDGGVTATQYGPLSGHWPDLP